MTRVLEAGIHVICDKPLGISLAAGRELAALHSFTPERVLDDHVQVMLRHPNGARGMLRSSQMATGCENALKLRVFGSKASLAFDQEDPNELAQPRWVGLAP